MQLSDFGIVSSNSDKNLLRLCKFFALNGVVELKIADIIALQLSESFKS